MELTTTSDEDMRGIDAVKNALDEAFEAGMSHHRYEGDKPDAQQLWESLMKIIGARV